MSPILRLRTPLYAIFSASRSASVARSTVTARPIVFSRRGYSASSLPKEDIEKRVINVIQSFEKVKPEKVRTYLGVLQ